METNEPSEQVSRFLGRLELRRRAAKRAAAVTLAVGAAVTGVAYLTVLGVLPIEAREVVASASAVVVGVAWTRS